MITGVTPILGWVQIHILGSYTNTTYPNQIKIGQLDERTSTSFQINYLIRKRNLFAQDGDSTYIELRSAV